MYHKIHFFKLYNSVAFTKFRLVQLPLLSNFTTFPITPKGNPILISSYSPSTLPTVPANTPFLYGFAYSEHFT